MIPAPARACHIVLLSALSCALSWIPAVRAQGGPPGGGVSSFLTVASVPEMIFAATDAGVFRSDNAGLSWAAMNQGLTNLDVSDVAGNPSLLFASTLGSGVFRSRDGGASWEPVNQGLENPVVFSLAADPADPDTVYAGTNNSGIFKTTTAGDSWAAVNNGLTEGNYLDIAIDPSDSNVIYAANSSLNAPGNGLLFKTVNAGEQWTIVAPGSAALTVEIDPADPSVLYVGTTNGISKLSNSGGSLDFTQLLGATVTGIAVDPSNRDLVYASTQRTGVFKSSDGGLSWEAASSGLPSAQLFALEIDPNSPSRLFLGADGAGVFRSSDAAQTWQLSSGGIGGADVRALAVDPRNTSTVLAGVLGGQLFRSANGGSRWEESRQGLQATQVRAIAFDPANPSTVYAGSVNPFFQGDGALFKSTDGGSQWQVLATDIAVFSIAVDPSSTQTLYIGTSIGVFKSTNGGERFEAVNDIEGNQDGLGFWNILDLAIDPANPRTLYAAALNSFDLATGQIFRTTNGGDEWEGAGAANALLAVEVDPADGNRIYVGGATGLFHSTDGGERYRRSSAGLPNEGVVSVSSVIVDARDSSAVYAATEEGVYKSTDRGDSWFAANAGLEAVQLRSLAVDPEAAGVIYAATATGGVFKTADGGQSWTPTGAFTGTSPIISRASIVSSAGFNAGGVSPGEIVAIFGLNIGPAEGMEPGFDPATGKVSTEAAGVKVFFGDHAAPLFFVREDQINAQAPFEVSGMETVEVRVEVNEESSNIATVAVAGAHPGVFNAVLNQDLSRNSAENPEAPGRVVVLFATGHGLVEPPVITGEPAPFTPPHPSPLLPASLTIGGQPAAISFIGLAPGFAGLLQINAELPLGLPAGEAKAVLRVGDTASEATASVFVR